jgi:UDP-glucose 4-epimerase
MTYLVTGGAGFIGSHIVEELLRRGHTVRVLDNFSTGKRRNLDLAQREAVLSGSTTHRGGGNVYLGQLVLFEGDIRDTALARLAVRGVDFILHQAALPSVERSVLDPTTTNDVNVNGTLNLLVAARDAGVKRFVFASSSSVYGNTPKLPKEESMAVQPVSPYAVSKLAAERYCVAFHEVYGVPTVCIRYFNVFGPRQDPTSQYSAVIPRFITAMLRGEAPVIYGDGLQSRDFTYVTNIVHANLLACERDEAIGKVMNVACGERYTLLELYRELQLLTGTNILPRFTEPRQGDVRHSMAAIEIAQRTLGYRPIVTWREGLRRSVASYTSSSKNPEPRTPNL